MTFEPAAVRAASMEVYVNGERIYTSQKEVDGRIKCPFMAKMGEKIDIRILIHAKESEESGIKECIRLYGGKTDV